MRDLRQITRVYAKGQDKPQDEETKGESE